MFLCLYLATLWSPAGKGLTSRLLFVMLYCVSVTFPCGIWGQVWYLIVLILLRYVAYVKGVLSSVPTHGFSSNFAY